MELHVEPCRCGHDRAHHADRDNMLQVVPLSMTEADADGAERPLPVTVRGAGACTIEGCACREFSDAP